MRIVVEVGECRAARIAHYDAPQMIALCLIVGVKALFVDVYVAGKSLLAVQQLFS